MASEERHNEDLAGIGAFLGVDGLLSRSANTKLDVVFALRRMLAEGASMDKLSTRELCQRAQISKSTFYKNFKDKYSVVQWYLDLLYRKGVAEVGRTVTWRRGHRITTCGILEVKDLFVNAAKSADYNAVNSYSRRKREQDMVCTLEQYHHVEVTPQIHGQIIAAAAAETAVMAHVTSGTLPLDEDDLVELLVSTVPHELFELMGTPVKRADI